MTNAQKSPPRNLLRELLHELADFLRRSPPGRWGFALTLLLIIVALAAPWLAPYDPVAQNLPARLVPPTAAHWMGTDELGRDILSRIIFGTRVSMLVSVSVVFGAGIIGLAIGAVAGYFGGWIDRFVNIILINAFLSFPGILLAIAFAAFLGPGLDKVILALVVTGWAGYARLARAQILQAKEMEYVLAARSLSREVPSGRWPLSVDDVYESHLAPEFGQQIHVARGLVAETKIKPLVHFTGAELFLQNALRKLPRSHQREITPKGKQQYGVDSSACQQAEFFWSRRKQLQSCLRPQNPRRMRLKGHSHGPGLMVSRPQHDFPQHMRMRPMHSVKVAHADQRRAKVGGNIVEFVKDLHKGERRRRTSALGR